MAIGDVLDMRARLRAALPNGWFPVTGSTDSGSASPTLDGVLSGLSWAWATLYPGLQFVAAQARIATASGIYLDIVALDYFALTLRRRAAEGDAIFSARIRAQLLPSAATRAALIANLTALTGRVPVVFEPADASDTGGYGHAGMTAGTGLAYNTAGGYGSLALPFQAFITAFRARGGGVANVAGYYAGTGWAGGGYGVGAIEYASPDMVLGAVTDSDILDIINASRPVAMTAWTRIES